MKTIIQDVDGDKLKVREYAVDLKEGDKVVWIDKMALVKTVVYDVTKDARVITIDINIPQDEVAEGQTV